MHKYYFMFFFMKADGSLMLCMWTGASTPEKGQSFLDTEVWEMTL